MLPRQLVIVLFVIPHMERIEIQVSLEFYLFRLQFCLVMIFRLCEFVSKDEQRKVFAILFGFSLGFGSSGGPLDPF